MEIFLTLRDIASVVLGIWFRLGGSLPRARLVGLSPGCWSKSGCGRLWVPLRLRLLVAWLEELEGAGWKELEVAGREYSSR